MRQMGHNTAPMLATEAITGIALFASVFGIVYVAVSARHRERMAMIDKGMDPNAGQRPENHRSLRAGMLLLGLGVGFLTGSFVDLYGFPQEGTPLPYFMMLLICGGLSLIAYHMIVRRRERD